MLIIEIFSSITGLLSTIVDLFYKLFMFIIKKKNFKKCLNNALNKTIIILKEIDNKESNKIIQFIDNNNKLINTINKNIRHKDNIAKSIVDLLKQHNRFYSEGISQYLVDEFIDAYYDGNVNKNDNQISNPYMIILEKSLKFNNCHLYINSIDSIDDINEKIINQTKDPKLNIDFFVSDDNEFKDSFKEHLCNDTIYVSGLYYEQTLLYILKCLKENGAYNNVFVISSLEVWEFLRDIKVKGLVLFPYFFNENRNIITENKNIIIIDENTSVGAEKLTLHKNTNKSIINKLEEYGYKDYKASSLIRETYGLYLPLKTKVYNGVVDQYNDFSRYSNKRFLVTAMLCQKWVKCEEDYKILRKLSNLDDEHIDNNIDILHDKLPNFIISKTIRGSKISFVPNCVDQLSVNLKWAEDIFEVYIESIVAGLTSTNISELLMNGLLNSLSYLSVALDDRTMIFDDSVSKIIDYYNNKNDIDGLLRILPDLCEISPKSVCDFLDKEIVNDSKLIKWYLEDNYFNSRLTRTLKILLLFKNYVYVSLKLILRLYIIEKRVNNNLGHLPAYELLKDIFCTWYNITALSNEEKTTFLRENIIKHEELWDVVYSELPNNNTIITSHNYPKYREYEKERRVLQNEFFDSNKDYFEICINNTKNDLSRINKMIDSLTKYDKNTIRDYLGKIEGSLNLFDDKEKESIKTNLRSIINKHRFHCDAEWALKETTLKNFEELLNKIKFNDDIYDYLYLSMPSYDFPLLNPVDFSKENDYHDANNKKIDEERSLMFEEFLNKKISINQYISLSKNDYESKLGECLAKYIDKQVYNENTLESLCNNNMDNTIICDYITNCKSINLKSALDYLYGTNSEKYYKVIVDILDYEHFEKYTDPKDLLLFNQPEIIKKMYFTKPFYRNDFNSSIGIWILDNCLKYENVEGYISVLFNLIDMIDKSTLYLYLLKMKSFNDYVIKDDVMFNYYISECLKVFIEEENIQRLNELARVETKFLDNIRWDDITISKKAFEYSPAVYSELVICSYKKDSKGKLINSKLYFNLYYNISFCPALVNGYVDDNNFIKWIEEFTRTMKNNKLEKVSPRLLGRLFSFSPADNEGIKPFKPIRDYIEKQKSEDMADAYYTSVFNSRGIVTASAGKHELELARDFYDNYLKLEKEYPFCSRIYYKLSKLYKNESIKEREEAEYDENGII